MRPVEEIEVDGIHAEPLQRCLERSTRRGRPLIGVRELRGDPDRIAVEPAGPDRRTDVRLVAIHGRRVHVPVSDAECRLDSALRVSPGRDLEDAEPELQNRTTDM